MNRSPYIPPFPCEHRFEFILESSGIRWISDAGATNPNATWYSLQQFNNPVILITQGDDRGYKFDILNGELNRIRALICIGDFSKKRTINTVRMRHQHLVKKVEVVVNVPDLNEAIMFGRILAHPGDVVMYSPMAPIWNSKTKSFDTSHHGRRFKTLVKEII